MPDVAAALGTPLARDPDGAAMRRTAVGAGDPDVGVAVPAVVAGYPDPVAVNGWGRGATSTGRGGGGPMRIKIWALATPTREKMCRLR